MQLQEMQDNTQVNALYSTAMQESYSGILSWYKNSLVPRPFEGGRERERHGEYCMRMCGFFLRKMRRILPTNDVIEY